MSALFTPAPRVRMAQKVRRPGGVGLQEAVAAAEAGLQTLRDDALGHVGVLAERLGAVRGPFPDAAALGAVRRDADELAGLCGLLALPELAQAALSLCRLLDELDEPRRAWGAIRVHLDAVRLFATTPPSALARIAPKVLEGLELVAARR